MPGGACEPSHGSLSRFDHARRARRKHGPGRPLPKRAASLSKHTPDLVKLATRPEFSRNTPRCGRSPTRLGRHHGRNRSKSGRHHPKDVRVTSKNRPERGGAEHVCVRSERDNETRSRTEIPHQFSEPPDVCAPTVRPLAPAIGSPAALQSDRPTVRPSVRPPDRPTDRPTDRRPTDSVG